MNLHPTVVIADRSEAFLMYLSILLNRLAFESLPVTSAVETHKLVAAVRPNVLILGGELEGKAPLALLKELRQDEALVGLPIYFCSANDCDREDALAAGATDFLVKPLSLELLFAALEKTRIFPGGHRRTPRIPYNRPVDLTWNGQTVNCQSVSLSEGGIYLRRRTPFPQGCLVDVIFPLDNDVTLELEGEIIYTMSLPKDRFTLPPGMAVRFLAPTETAVGRLRRMISAYLIGDILAEQDEPVVRT